MPNLSAIDLFSGSGGLTLGLKKAGFNVLGAIEIDPLAAETYRKNHPETRLWEQDIRSVDPAEIRVELQRNRVRALHLTCNNRGVLPGGHAEIISSIPPF